MRLLRSLWQRFRSTLQLARAVRLVWRAAPGLTATSLGLMVIQGVLPLTSLYLTKLQLITGF